MSGLPNGWAVTTFAEVTRNHSGNSNLIKGKLLPSKEEGSYPAFSASGQDVWCNHYEHEGEAIIVSAVGARCGKAFLASGKWSAIANTHVVWPEERAVDVHFLFLLLNNESFWEKGGSAQPFVKVKSTFSRKLRLPPLPEQRRIVAKIDSLSAKSKRARNHLDRIPRLVERYKQAILNLAFSRISGDLVPLGTLAELITSGSRDWSKYYDRGKSVFVLAGNIRPMAFDPSPRRYVDPPLDGADARRSRIKCDDLLITIVGANTGDVCRVPVSLENYFVCQSVALIRLLEPEKARYIELYLNSNDHGAQQIRQAIYGQGRPHLSFEDLRRLLVPNLPIDQAKDIVRRIEAAFEWIERLATDTISARKLIDHLDQAILAKAFRGELVPQDPTDEPASVLLERIRAERQSTVQQRGSARRASRSSIQLKA